MDLRARAIISAVDRFSGPVQRMAGALRGLTTQAASVTRNATRHAGALASGAGVPAGLLTGLAMRGEYDIDRLARQMQSVGELTEQQRQMLTRQAFDSSLLLGEGPDDLLRAQRELVQGGLDPDTVARTTTLIGQAAKSNAMSLQQVAEDAINVSRGLGLAFETSAERVASLTRSLEFMSVVPSLSTETWQGLREAMKYAAPVAGALKIPISELGAALSVLADAGFKGEQGGTAFRTMLLRMLSPTRQATYAMRAAGIQLENLYTIDQSRVGDMARLKERLAAAGFETRGLDRTLAGFRDPTKFDGLYEFTDKLQAALMERLGIDRGDAESRGILKRLLDQHVFAGVQSLNIERYFTELAKLPVQEFKQLFGIMRTSQAIALQRDLARMAPLIERFEELMPGAVQRRFDIMDEGFAMAIDKAVASLKLLRHAVFDSGFATQLATTFEGLAKGFQSLSQTNPAVLNAAGWTALLTALAAGISAIASSPLAKAVLALGAVATAMGAVDPEKGALGSAGDAIKGADSWLNRQLGLFNEDGTVNTTNRPSMLDFLFGNGTSEMMNRPLSDLLFGSGSGGLVRDLDPTAGPATVDVQGQARVTIDNEVRVRFENGVAVVTGLSGGRGEVRVPLDTGRGMPDVAPPGARPWAR